MEAQVNSSDKLTTIMDGLSKNLGSGFGKAIIVTITSRLRWAISCALMKMSSGDFKTLHDQLVCGANCADQYLHATRSSCILTKLLRGSSLSIRPSELYGLSVLVATRDQLTAALTLVEIDGLALRLVLYPPDLPPEYLPQIVTDAEIDAIVTDGEISQINVPAVPIRASCHPAIRPADRVQIERKRPNGCSSRPDRQERQRWSNIL